MDLNQNENDKSKCQICIIKKVSELSVDKNNNNNNFRSKSRNESRDRHKHYNYKHQRALDLLSLNNQEIISLEPPRIDPHDIEQANSISLKILITLCFHFVCIISCIICFCYLEEINSKYSLNSFLLKLTNLYPKYLVYLVYFLMFCLFILIVSVARFRMQSPLHFFIFIIYTIIMSLFYSYLTLYHYTNLFVEFFAIVLLSLILLVFFCSCQRKFSLINLPYLPYVYTFTSLIMFLIIYCCIKIYFIQTAISLTIFKQKITFDFILNIVVSFIYIFYILFDLQFILGNTSLIDYDILTLAFNLLTKDIVQLTFIFNSFILSLIK